MHPHAGRTLHERLDDQRREPVAVRAQLAPRLVERSGAGVVLAHAVAPAEQMRWRQAQDVEQQRAVEAVEGLAVTDRHRADGVAVVGLDQRREARALRLAAQLAGLERDLERDLDGGRTGVGVEHARQAGRRHLYQPRRQLGGGRVREAEHGRVRDPVELRAHGGVDGRVAVAVHVAPQRRDPVEVAPAVLVDQLVALGGGDDQRLGREPVAHLRERVPEEAPVEVGGGVARGRRLRCAPGRAGVVHRVLSRTARASTAVAWSI